MKPNHKPFYEYKVYVKDVREEPKGDPDPDAVCARLVVKILSEQERDCRHGKYFKHWTEICIRIVGGKG